MDSVGHSGFWGCRELDFDGGELAFLFDKDVDFSAGRGLPEVHLGFIPPMQQGLYCLQAVHYVPPAHAKISESLGLSKVAYLPQHSQVTFQVGLDVTRMPKRGTASGQ